MNGGLSYVYPAVPVISNARLPANFAASDLNFLDEDHRAASDLFFAIAYPAAKFSWAAFARIGAAPYGIPTSGPVLNVLAASAAASDQEPSRLRTASTAERPRSRSDPTHPPG